MSTYREPSGQFNLDTGTRLALLEERSDQVAKRLSRQENVLDTIDSKLDKVVVDLATMSKSVPPSKADDHVKIPKSLFTALGTAVGAGIMALINHFMK